MPLAFTTAQAGSRLDTVAASFDSETAPPAIFADETEPSRRSCDRQPSGFWGSLAWRRIGSSSARASLLRLTAAIEMRWLVRSCSAEAVKPLCAEAGAVPSSTATTRPRPSATPAATPAHQRPGISRTPARGSPR